MTSFCLGHQSLDGLHRKNALPRRESSKKGSKISEEWSTYRREALSSSSTSSFWDEAEACTRKDSHPFMWWAGCLSWRIQISGTHIVRKPGSRTSYSFLAVVVVSFYVISLEVLYFLWPFRLHSTSGLLQEYFLPNYPLLNLGGVLVSYSKFIYALF